MKQAAKWVQYGAAEKSPLKSRTLAGVGASFLTRTAAFATFLAANPDTVQDIARAIGGQEWAVWAGFAVGFLGDLLATWARIDDHVKGRNR